jgi:tRNA dimethylallyltransferase
MIYLIQGPTASGKTSLAIQLAKQLNTEILSADSRQFYQEMNIGTAKPTKKELDMVKHHFIDNRTLDNPMNVAVYESEALPILNKLLHTNGSAVVTGGSSQFVDALIMGLDPIPVFPELQMQLNSALEEKGIIELQERLKALDLPAYETIDIQNSRRLIRALEVNIGTGKSILSFQQKKRLPRFPVKRFFIQWDRTDLYNRINFRVDQMISDGLEAEVKSLSKYKHVAELNTVGYKEWDVFFNGVASKESVIEKIKQNSRNYAKRQLTWMNQYEDLTALNPYDERSIFDQLLTVVNPSNESQ